MAKAETIGNITIHGTRKEREKAKKVLSKIRGLEDMPEPEARIKIQDAIDHHKLTATILYNHNTVWSRTRIIRNLNQIMKTGTLYDPRRPSYMPVGSMLRSPTIGRTILTQYFYQFLSGICGSIAHYNIRGWVYHYPTVESLKSFFKRNEYGMRVLDWIPGWYTDAKRIVEEIERTLFPFQTYLREKSKA